MSTNTQVDFFICHASEDKETFVRALAQFLMRSGASLFYDEFSLKIGDSLFAKINEGIRVAKNAIVVLSPSFFEKPWANAELDAIFSLHLSGMTRLLLIWHGVTLEQVRNRYPLLVDSLALNSSEPMHELAGKLFAAAGFVPSAGWISMGEMIVPAQPEGVMASVLWSLGPLNDPYRNKYIFDWGNVGIGHSRLSLYVGPARTLTASATSSDGSCVSLGIDAVPFIGNVIHLLWQLSPTRSAFELYVDGELRKAFSGISQGFMSGFNLSGSAIIFNSIELVHPCPGRLLSYAVAKAFEETEVRSYHSAIMNFNQSVGRI